jgi:SAM-dependent methyltransferase
VETYDEIGRGYSAARVPDRRIARAIAEALGDSSPVLNVGAGAGAYEPSDLGIVAVEPSLEMISQRRSPAPVVRAIAERLPFADGSFPAAMATLAVHHWGDPVRGLRELRRIASGRVAILTCDPDHHGFWLTEDYFPGIHSIDRKRMPPLSMFESVLGSVEVRTVMIPHDCTDGFLGAFWRRPDAYLDPAVRRGISSFHMLSKAELEEGAERLSGDLASGRWRDRHGHLLARREMDIGYRLVVDRGGR